MAGPDGHLWFTEYNIDQIGQITAAGVITLIVTIAIATFALRVVSSLFREEAR